MIILSFDQIIELIPELSIYKNKEITPKNLVIILERIVEFGKVNNLKFLYPVSNNPIFFVFEIRK